MITRRSAIVAGMGTCACAMVAGCSSKVEAPKLTKKLVVIHTNDMHGYFASGEDKISLASVAALKTKYKEQGANVLLVDAGDATNGSCLSYADRGLPAIELMNMAGYDGAVPGIFDFDWSQEEQKNLLEVAEFPILAANLVNEETLDPLIEQHSIITFKDGLKVGLFGITSYRAKTILAEDRTEGYRIYGDDLMCDIAQEQVDFLKSEGCDYVICLSYLGKPAHAGDNTSRFLLLNVEGIDFLADGGDHTVYQRSVGETFAASTGAFLEHVGVVSFFSDGTKVEALESIDSNDVVEDPEIVSEVDKLMKKCLVDVIGESKVDLVGNPDVVRKQETNLCNLVADAYIWAAQQGTGKEVDGCVANGGEVRHSIGKGDLFKGNIEEALPFKDTVCIVELSGAELLESIAAATFTLEAEEYDDFGGFAQVSGITYTLYSEVPFESGELYPDSTYEKPINPEKRVKIEDVNGRGFDLDATYVIAVNNYIAHGGDTYYVVKQAFLQNGVDTGVNNVDALTDFITEELDGVVGSEYAEPRGLITIA